MTWYAHAWRNGVIDVSEEPDRPGLAPLYASDDPLDLHRRLAILSIHAKSGTFFMVPGMREARTDAEATAAVALFVERINAPEFEGTSLREVANA